MDGAEGGGELPPMDDAPAPELPPMDDAPAPELPPMDEAGGDDEQEMTPAEEIENRLADMEQILDEVRDFVSKLEDERLADVDVNVFTGKGKDGESISAESGGLSALSSEIVSNLKNAYRRLDSSADELSLVAETYDNISKLSQENREQFTKLAAAAVRDADQITGETRGLMRLAGNSVMVDDADSPAMPVNDDASYDNADTQTLEMAANSPEYTSMSDDSDDNADDASDQLVAEAMELRRTRREAILKQAEDRVLAERAANREALLSTASEAASDEVAEDAVADEEKVSVAAESQEDSLVSTLNAKVAEKKIDEERENYRIKLRRAYDVGLDMQRKGLLAHSKTALDKQVDEIMTFDNNAFEAFKRSIANAKPVSSIKVASDLGGVNIGVGSDRQEASDSPGRMSAEALSSMWE